ncbi:MAG: exodeoxyribonuclease VII small subunit [Chromatiales bacterium]|nr:exodeoxyribonuclease VII small subunit [Chromatiales bacterium]
MVKQSSSKKKGFNFEESLNELEELVERLEVGDQTLESSLKDFERGVELTRSCQTALQDAEQRVEQLIEKSGVEQLAIFNTQSTDE